MKTIVILSLAITLVSCASSKIINGPDGSPHQLIRCGMLEKCYEKATEVCGKYKIVNTATETSGMNGNTSSTINLLVKCDN